MGLYVRYASGIISCQLHEADNTQRQWMRPEIGRKRSSSQVHSLGSIDSRDRSVFHPAHVQPIQADLDAPWCSMTSTHASKKHLDTLPAALRAVYVPPSTKAENFSRGKAVKGRNEACAIGAVAWTIYKARNDVSFQELVDSAFNNTVNLFGLDERKRT